MKKLLIILLASTIFLSSCSLFVPIRIDLDFLETEETPQKETTPPAPKYPELPEELQNHILLDAKNDGSCKALCGKTEFTFVFTDDTESSWTEKEISEYKPQIEAEIKLLHDESAFYGTPFEYEIKYARGKISVAANMENSKDWGDKAVLKATGLESSHFTSPDDGVETPAIYVFNRRGRSFARSRTSNNLEYAVLYAENTNVRHEVLHMFGAVDYYFQDIVIAAAKKYFPQSVMLDDADTTTVDDFTAFLVGWCDAPSETALKFMWETYHITDEEFDDASDQNSFTGEIESYRMQEAVYSGGMLEGDPHGIGKMIWDNGDMYEGEWSYGTRSGKGVYIWADGSTYDGEWQSSLMHGHGICRYKNGDIYDGEWQNGEMHGEGTYTKKNGKVITGIWEKGELVERY